MQFVRGAADHALAPIPLPHFEFDRRRNDSPSHDGFRCGCGYGQVLLADNGFESEFVDQSMLVTLGPGVHEVKDPIVAPNSWSNLLVHAHALWTTATGLRVLCGSVELAVLCEVPRRKPFTLIQHLGIA